jgi:hypothetical protein
MTNYTARAIRSDRYWELHISGPDGPVGVTQARRLTEAEAMVSDYLATDGITDATVSVEVSVPDLDAAVSEARAATKQAAFAQIEAGRKNRYAAIQLKSKGLTGEEIGKVMGIGKARVSQLTK